MGVQRCKELLDAYWQRNWSVLKIAKAQYIKTLKDGSKWLKNPVSGFYYSLRNDRDTFSTLNQGTGVMIVDLWIMFMRKKGLVVSMQYHDEVLVYTGSNKKAEVQKLMEEAMQQVNDTLKLNVTLNIDVNFGDSYAEAH